MVLRNLHWSHPNVSSATHQHVRKYHPEINAFGDGDPRKPRVQKIHKGRLPTRGHETRRKDIVFPQNVKYFTLPKPSKPPTILKGSFPNPGGRFKGSGRLGLQGLH